MVGVDVREAMNTVTKPVIKATPYLDAYDRHFARFQGSELTMLEIGVNAGGSLQMWRSYLGPGATLVGVDIDEACRAHEGDGIHVRIGDQEDRGFLASLHEEFGPFTIVVDDGGHTMAQQRATFEVLFPLVPDGGVYVCEDTSTSYSPAFGGGRGNPASFIEAMKARIDDLHAWFDGEPTEFTLSAASIHFYCGMVVIE
jgi:cephalosporin hydroxylase